MGASGALDKFRADGGSMSLLGVTQLISKYETARSVRGGSGKLVMINCLVLRERWVCDIGTRLTSSLNGFTNGLVRVLA